MTTTTKFHPTIKRRTTGRGDPIIPGELITKPERGQRYWRVECPTWNSRPTEPFGPAH